MFQVRLLHSIILRKGYFSVILPIFFLSLTKVISLNAQVPEDLVEVSISSEVKTIKPGDSVWVMVSVKVQAGWHMYWKNAGQSGYPTTIEWDTSDGSMGPLRFPSPKAYDFLNMLIYVHEGEFSLLSEFSLNEDFELGKEVEINGTLSTLVCNEENCLPFAVELSLKLTAAEQTKNIPEESSKIEQAIALWPASLPPDATLSAKVSGDSIGLRISHPSFSTLESDLFHFFPASEFFGHTLTSAFTLETENGTLDFSMPVKTELRPPRILAGVLTHPGLGNGWAVEWGMDSVQYGKGNMDAIPGPVSYQIIQDDMGIGVLLLMIGIVVIAFAVWLYGKGGVPGISRKVQIRYRIFSIAVGVFGLWLAFPFEESPSKEKIKWGVWSPELEQKLTSEGKAVYVDYTAKWCASCIANKRAYTFDSVIDLFKSKEIVALRADWTDRGPVILESLQSYGRFGVPLNVFHPSTKETGVTASPVLLPEILTRENIRKAVEEGKTSIDSNDLNFWAIVGFASLGGLILNLMPCVFPVIGLKIMSFVKQAGEDPAEIKKHGLIFTLGVVLSFWVLVTSLLVLRESFSEELGWGFQLQEPVFVFALSVFLLVFAMSLSGIFEIGMSLTGVGSKLTQTGGLSSSFFSGVLATVVATPCMAPFLGVAVGAALTMEWIPAFIVFTFVALGLSTPYLVLSFFPKWMSRLPKPGAWMDSFKQAMAFPLYATVAWLLWTLQSLL